MRCHAVAALLAVLSCLSGAAALAADSARPLLRVTWIENADLDPFAFLQMENESREILGRLGLRLRLRRGEPDGDAAGGFRVVLANRFAPGGRNILGGVVIPHSREGTARIWIFRPQVRALLWNASLAPGAARREGIALGRVLAHEIVHALVPDLPHAEDGLMAGKLSAGSLCRPVSIDAGTLAALHDASASLEAQAEPSGR